MAIKTCDEPVAHALEDLPLVLFIEDLARVLGCSRATIDNRRRAGTFPIPELASIDKRPRWSREAVLRYLQGESHPAILGRRRRA
jgi:hypothetical protein